MFVLVHAHVVLGVHVVLCVHNEAGHDLLFLNLECTWYMHDSVAISVVCNIIF